MGRSGQGGDVSAYEVVGVSCQRLGSAHHHRTGEFDAVVRFQQLDFPSTGPATASAEQGQVLADAVADAARQEARYGQIVLTDWSGSGAIVAVENLQKRGQPDCLVWLA